MLDGSGRQAASLVAWGGEDTTPFASRQGEAGFLLRRLQRGESLGMPHSRPMPAIGPRCHELRINDGGATWGIIYRIDTDAIVIIEVFSKKTAATPKAVITACKRRLWEYDHA